MEGDKKTSHATVPLRVAYQGWTGGGARAEEVGGRGKQARGGSARFRLGQRFPSRVPAPD